MAQQSSSSTSTLYPQLESSIAPIDEGDINLSVIRIEKDLVAFFRQAAAGDPLVNVADRNILPTELLADMKKSAKPKVDPLKRLKELPTDEAEEEEETEDEEEEDEEPLLEDEEDDAGGDYVVSHFDNGEGYEDNDDDGEDMTSMI